jgi:hypothetical protein
MAPPHLFFCTHLLTELSELFSIDYAIVVFIHSLESKWMVRAPLMASGPALTPFVLAVLVVPAFLSVCRRYQPDETETGRCQKNLIHTRVGHFLLLPLE